MGPNGREKHGLNFSPYLRSSLSLYRQRRELGQIGWGQTATDVTGSHARAIDSSVVHPGEKKNQRWDLGLSLPPSVNSSECERAVTRSNGAYAISAGWLPGIWQSTSSHHLRRLIFQLAAAGHGFLCLARQLCHPGVLLHRRLVVAPGAQGLLPRCRRRHSQDASSLLLFVPVSYCSAADAPRLEQTERLSATDACTQRVCVQRLAAAASSHAPLGSEAVVRLEERLGL
jgi:hypothetical protein